MSNPANSRYLNPADHLDDAIDAISMVNLIFLPPEPPEVDRAGAAGICAALSNAVEGLEMAREDFRELIGEPVNGGVKIHHSGGVKIQLPSDTAKRSLNEAERQTSILGGRFEGYIR